ncbi:lipopolysaccharide 1,6-galactosyltransferase [Sporolactobacillus kofuensis]|uniref:Lipopolysaccharide 1,6-galactosyltransferase n=1 Tax=Sporolactobacillus kofuensis TaxID=269672 RepID=A0ABW1WDF3_9BACL|nr:lipopolysaccharide 1,6-galactosyltransferase [Sporolactobacillus kofuensis]
MRKIVIITPHLSGLGGTETVLRDVVAYTNSHYESDRIKLFLLGGTDDESWLDGLPSEVHTFMQSNKLVRVWNKFSTFYKFLRDEEPDIVVSIDTKLIKVCYMIRKMMKLRFSIVSWIHFSLFNEPLVNVKLLKCADAHLCISTGISKQMQSIGIDPSKLFTIYNPIPRNSSTIERPEQNVDFLYIGRVQFEGQKRMKDLLTTLSHVKGEWKLNIYGDGEDTDLCKQFAIKLGIANQIVWHGWVKNAWSIIDRATALLLSSAYEGLPMVLAEALSRGIYCVSSDCDTGPRDLIKPNINGELYKPGDLIRFQTILQSIVNSEQRLPDHEKIKETISFLYAENYYRNLKQVFDQIQKRSK